MKIAGYAAVFNSWSADLGGFVEVIRPGAFTRTLQDGHPIFGLHHHSMRDVLGSTLSRSLTLSEDHKGLHFELALPETSLARDIYTLVKRGDVSAMSFAFAVNGAAGESWRERGGRIERELLDIDLFEISTVARPAYPATSVSARSAVLLTAGQARRNAMRRRMMLTRLRAA